MLKDNYEQSETLALAEAQAAGMVDVHTRFLEALESVGQARPRARGAADGEELVERTARRAG